MGLPTPSLAYLWIYQNLSPNSCLAKCQVIAHRAATAAVNTHCSYDWPSNTQLVGCENSNHAFMRLTQRKPSLRRPPFHPLTDKAYLDRFPQQLWKNRAALRARCGNRGLV